MITTDWANFETVADAEAELYALECNLDDARNSRESAELRGLIISLERELSAYYFSLDCETD